MSYERVSEASLVADLRRAARRLEWWLCLSVCGWLLTFGVMTVSAWKWQEPAAQPGADALCEVTRHFLGN